jgi:hypothetical protein
MGNPVVTILKNVLDREHDHEVEFVLLGAKGTSLVLV